jgi:hypothetical protein
MGMVVNVERKRAADGFWEMHEARRYRGVYGCIGLRKSSIRHGVCCSGVLGRQSSWKSMSMAGILALCLDD